MSPITQIIYLRIPPEKDLKESTEQYYGKLWAKALDVIEKSAGFQRVYWGRSLEQPENVQIHIVRPTLDHHKAFTSSPAFGELTAILEVLSSSNTSPILAVRHAPMSEFTPNCKALAKGAPFTGSAIYLQPTAAWNEGAWPLWTHIVRYIHGCMGCAGGPLLESTELLGEPVLVGEGATEEMKAEVKKGKDGGGGPGGKWQGYIVYVGWETVEKHEAYHHTKHFKEHAVVLRCGNAGFAEYGHIVFEGERFASSSRL